MELNLTVVGNHCMYVWKLELKFESAAVLKVTFPSTETVLLEHLGHGDQGNLLCSPRDSIFPHFSVDMKN